MARRRRRSAKLKKKPDQTTLIVILSGVTFIIAIFLLFGLTSDKPTNKATQKNNKRQNEFAENKPLKQSKLKARPNAKPKVIRQSLNFSESTNKRQQDVPASLNTSSIHDLPDYFDLPEVNRKSKKLTATSFADSSSLTVDLVGGEEIDLLQSIAKSQSEKSDKNQNGVWLLKNNSNSKTLAEIRFDKNGVLYTWNEEIHPNDVHLIHNSRLHIASKMRRKTFNIEDRFPCQRFALQTRNLWLNTKWR